jgi:hypothetical protein
LVIPSSELEIGDEVLVYHQDTGKTSEYLILAVHVHDDPIIIHLTIDGEQSRQRRNIPSTQPMANGSTQLISKLGDQIGNLDGGFSTVESVTVIHQTQTMYNFTAEEAYTFFVGDGQHDKEKRLCIAKPLPFHFQCVII